MTKETPPTRNAESIAVKAEAAAWIARLHSPDRTPADERSFQRWLQASSVHHQAFEQMTELWDASARVKTNTLAQVMNRSNSRWRPTVLQGALAFTVTCVIAVFAGVFLLRDPVVVTGVGELRTITLDDGTRVTLNTATRIKAQYTDNKRRVVLDTGEAFFEVARKSDWPFVVAAAGKEVTALGTAFVVRRDEQRICVTLIEGKVKVTDPSSASLPASPTSSKRAVNAKEDPRPAAVMNEPVVLAVGQRASFSPELPPAIDEPSLDAVTAWKSGLVALDNIALSDAVAEMNRYSAIPIIIEGVDADVRVSGVFRAGDSQEFARAVARAYGLEVREQGRALFLSGRPLGAPSG